MDRMCQPADAVQVYDTSIFSGAKMPWSAQWHNGLEVKTCN